MFTICPKCTLTLGVTAADLRAGQGYVRCGRCTNVFNALLTLSEAPVEALSPTLTTPAPALQPQWRAPAHAPHPPSSGEMPGASAVDDHGAAMAAEPLPSAPAAESFNAVLPPEPSSLMDSQPPAGVPAANESIESRSNIEAGTGTFETIVLEGDAILQTEEFVSEQDVDLQIAAFSQRLDFAAAQPLSATPESQPGAGTTDGALTGDEPSVRRLEDTDVSRPDQDTDIRYAGDEAVDPAAWEAPARAATEQTARDPAAWHGLHTERETTEPPADGTEAGDEFFRVVPPAPPVRRRWPWLAGSALLLLLLGAQAVNHWRDTLAAQPLWNRPLSQLYARLGIALTPQWNLNAYDVRQQGAQSDPAHAGAIRIRLSIANHARRPQPLPVLRLTLLDSYGRRIAARDLAPAQYLPAAAAKHRFLGPDQRIDTAVSVQDPNADSTSFELDWCLASSRGPALRCAGDAPAVAAN